MTGRRLETMTFNTSAAAGVQHLLANLLNTRPHTGQQDVDDTVAAVITVENDLRFLGPTVQAVLSQHVLPGTIVVADCSGRTTTSVYSTFEVIRPRTTRLDHFPEVASVQVQIVGASGALSFGDAVGKALGRAHIGDGTKYLWLLHDDSRPASETCLEKLVEAHRNAPTASIIGAKQLDWEASTLHDVGSYAAPGHKVSSLVVDGEPDQEQYDGRQDVFAVSLAGALVPLSVWNEHRGVIPWMTTFGESKDLCRRVCLGGGRVLVEPKAVIAHRRARFEGVRSRSGAPLDDGDRVNYHLAVITAQWRYRITDIGMPAWPLQWLWLLLRSVVMLLVRLFDKQPYEGLCELALPWRALVNLPKASSARRRVRRAARVSLAQLNQLVANRMQMKRWRERLLAFESQRDVVLLSPLAKLHLKRQWRIRAAWAATMTVGLTLAMGVTRWNVVLALFSGGSLVSDRLLSTGASFAQVWQSATTAWSYGMGLGVSGPPHPFLLVLGLASIVTGGHVAAAIALMYLLSAPLAALSFWALAGTFTRSNAVRVAGGVMWSALAAAMGLYHDGDLPMMVVMVFLPAAFAFTLRAVAMNLTEEPVRPEPSVQSAALASLCFIPVIDAEPQLLLPLTVTFLAIMVLVRRHRLMLLLIPVPAAFSLAPTLVNVVGNMGAGQWRELFADAMVASTASAGSPRSMSLMDVIMQAFGVDLDSMSTASGTSGTAFPESVASWIVQSPARHAGLLISMACIALIAVVALLLPQVLRVSRMMWVAIVAGAALSLVSPRIAVGLDADGAVSGSVLPGFALLCMGLLACMSMVAGTAVKRFAPLDDLHATDRGIRQSLSWPSAGRMLLTIVMICCVGLWGWSGYARTMSAGGVTVARQGLPMVAVDYLQQDPSHRILAVQAESSTMMDFTVMRTARGELIDNSPLVSAFVASGRQEQSTETMASALASLLSNSDAEAVQTLSDLGFGGIYVVADESESTVDSAYDDLVSHITASEGTQNVVSGSSGTYFRLTLNDTTTQGVDVASETAMCSNGWRLAWLWCLGLIVAVYCLVALPSARKREQEWV